MGGHDLSQHSVPRLQLALQQESLLWSGGLFIREKCTHMAYFLGFCRGIKGDSTCHKELSCGMFNKWWRHKKSLWQLQLTCDILSDVHSALSQPHQTEASKGIMEAEGIDISDKGEGHRYKPRFELTIILHDSSKLHLHSFCTTLNSRAASEQWDS